MSAWDTTRLIEAKSLRVLERFLRDRAYDGRLVIWHKGALAKALQAEYGDAAFNTDEGTIWTVELKAEERHTGNLFLEIWSNKNLDDRGRHAEIGSRPGWLVTQRADLLLYYFLDTDDLYVAKLFDLKRWAFGGRNENGRLAQYRQTAQGKYAQLNDTHGHLVPIEVLMRAGVLKHMKARQIEMKFGTVSA